MFKDFIEYNFGGEVNDYLASYDSSKLNMGHLMYRLTDETGQTYVTPTETKFLRGWEIGNLVDAFRINNLGFVKYTDNISWVFYTNADSLGTVVKRIFLATYDKSLNELKEMGSINVNYNPNATHACNSLIPSLENHTGGTVTVVGNTVSGSGTTWSTDGVCSGNRIGFGSTNPEDITTWYTISSVVDNTNLIISREYSSDGIVENLNLSGGTPYVIEDLRLIYVNRASSAAVTTRGIALVKGLRIENFTPSPLTIPAATTIDNLRACYRLLDSATTSATFIPTGIILEDKVSLTEQYLFVQSNPATTSINIQRFNVRAALTLTAGRSDSAFNFTTGTVNHNGTNINLINPFIKGSNGDYYVNLFTRISRIIPANITNGSTTFIGDTMIENPPGTSTTFPLSSQLSGFHYLPNADRFYISHNQGTTRNYVTPYSTSGEFERVVNLNDVIESNTYVVSELDTLTSNFISLPLRTFYHNGLSYVARDVANNRNVLYTLPIEADKEYHTTTKACIITPEFTTPDVVNYDKVYLRTKSTYNKGRFISPSENVDIYFRTSGITDDSGSWTLVDKTGDISFTSGSTIQFKIAFSTIGLTCIPDKVYGITMSYFSNGIPLSTPFYEPSLKQSDISSQIFSWRQIHEFVDDIPELNIDIYDVSGSTLLLTDDTDTSLNGVWEYSSNDGVSWSAFTQSANTIGNYIRYTPNSSLGSGITVKPIIYETTISIASAPINQVPPSISGGDNEGDTLTVSVGSWNSFETITYSYQWKRDGVDISGETSTTYIITSADIGTLITCLVTATNNNGSNSLLSNSIVGGDVDALLFLSTAEITNTTIVSAINRLVNDLKVANIWGKMQAIYPFVGGTASTHKWNLKDPQDTNAAFRLVFNGGWTHGTNGIEGNGTNGYADTFYIQNSHLPSQDDHHISIYSRSNINEVNKRDFGVRDGVGPITRTDIIIADSLTNSIYVVSNDVFETFSDTSSLGHMIANRTSSNLTNSFRNGVLAHTSTSASVRRAQYKLYIGAASLENTPFGYTTKQYAFATIGLGLNDTEASDLYNAIQTFQTTLGRQV
jgi:hypothetical protein